MTMDELKRMCEQARIQNSSSLYLQVTRKRPTRGEGIQIKGFGRGIVVSEEQNDQGEWVCTCYFKRAVIERNIARFEAGERF